MQSKQCGECARWVTSRPVGDEHPPRQLPPHQRHLILEYRVSWVSEHRIQSGCTCPLGLRHTHGLESEPTIAESIYTAFWKRQQ